MAKRFTDRLGTDHYYFDRESGGGGGGGRVENFQTINTCTAEKKKTIVQEEPRGVGGGGGVGRKWSKCFLPSLF